MTSPLEYYSAYLDGRCLADAEIAALRQWIAADPKNADEFIQLALVHAAITDRLMIGRLLDDLASRRRDAVVTPDMLAAAIREIEVNSPRVELPAPPPPVEPTRPMAAWIPAVAAVLAFICLGAWVLWQSPEVDSPSLARVAESSPAPAPAAGAPAQPPVVATVSASFNASWNQPRGARTRDAIRQGAEFDLASGVVEFEMASGAAVVVEGPSRFTLTSDQSLALRQGKAAVRIVDGAGAFVVNTPTLEVLDLGTEFGVETGAAGPDRVMVFDGAVELAEHAVPKASQPPAEQRRLDAGFEVRLDADSAAAPPAPRPLANPRYFLRPDEVQVRLRALAGSAADRRLAAHYERQRVPGLLAYQGFDPISGGFERTVGLGSQGLLALGAMQFASDGAALSDAVDIQGGPVFMFLDTSPQGGFAQAGLLTSAGMIGQTGAEVWMSWQTQRILVDDAEIGSAGLSLMFGERSDVDEPVFFGRPHGEQAELCLQTSWGNARPPAGVRVTELIDFNLAESDTQSRLVDGGKHTWYARIEFHDGADRASIWVDVDPGQLPAAPPQGVLEVEGIEFDRVRFAVNRGREVWRFSEFAMAVDPEAFEKLRDVAQFSAD